MVAELKGYENLMPGLKGGRIGYMKCFEGVSKRTWIIGTSGDSLAPVPAGVSVPHKQCFYAACGNPPRRPKSRAIINIWIAQPMMHTPTARNVLV